MKNKIYATAITILSIALFQVSSQAALLTFDLVWSGQSFGNNASATGSITLDDSVLINPGNNDLFNNPAYISDFSITIVNASSGNGTWTLADFGDIIFQTPVALDLTQELIGQPTNVDPWGTSLPGDTGGDFNLFTALPGAPLGTYYFELTTDGGLGDSMLLTSFAPTPIPVPAAFWLLLSGIAALRLKFRR